MAVADTVPGVASTTGHRQIATVSTDSGRTFIARPGHPHVVPFDLPPQPLPSRRCSLNSDHFDALARTSVSFTTRRLALIALLNGAVAAMGLADTEAGAATCKPGCNECQACKKGRCKKTSRGKKCKKGTCQAKAKGTPCSIGTCRNGTCQTCTPGLSCSTTEGACRCEGPPLVATPVCVALPQPGSISGSCPESCPATTICLTIGVGVVVCASPCTAA